MALEDKKRTIGTDVVHGDSVFQNRSHEVAPSISVTTSFQATLSNPEPTVTDIREGRAHGYSRLSQPTSTRVESVLSKIHDGYALTYGSGLAAAQAVLEFYKPKKIAITGGYYGVHLVIENYKRDRGVEVVDIDIEDYAGVDLCWIETPLNPTGEARNLQYYADRVHAVGGQLVVDATFAPPPLQYPFKWGVDMIMHSGSKYLGGHSDLLNGTLVVKTETDALLTYFQLWKKRYVLGSPMGSFEAWLLLRSLRTLHLRVPRQSASATHLAQWLDHIARTPAGETYDGVPGGIIEKTFHSSLQGQDGNAWSPAQQMEGGGSPTFAILMARPEWAEFLPRKLELFTNATSLGGVESLIEQRAKSSPGEDPRIVRISVGVEEVEDLKDDMRRVLQAISQVSLPFAEMRPDSKLTVLFSALTHISPIVLS
ncbi:cystathionine gamma-synthase [Vararia minispora EC-137]|uniref:Cystathionine gamma-synthase n=1 Tax=Vararia minispora EC-137 TaxID=1314806 RepID=A0ACB8QW63_9AGAM|nr:cystathionine gamma-synthase [Vararia minispora EC-137]